MITGYDYLPMPNGETRQMTVQEITGHVVRVSTGAVITSIPSDIFDYRIDILSVAPHANSPQPNTFEYGNGFYGLSFYKTVLTGGNALWTGHGVAWDGQQQMPYLGEARNQFGNFILPPEPQLPLFPRVGQVLDVHSSVYYSEDNPTVALADYRSSLYVLEHAPTWKAWSDVWITVLTERTGAAMYLYEYCFARGLGVVDAWAGQFDNGQIVGYEYTLVV